MKSAAIQGAANLLAAASGMKNASRDKVPEVDFSVVMTQAGFQNQETLQSSVSGSQEKSVSARDNLDKTQTRSEKGESDFWKTLEKQEVQESEALEAASDNRVTDTGKNEAEQKGFSEEVLSKVSEFISKVQQMLEEGFSMTEEELMSALEELGFTMADFLNPVRMNECIQALSGAQDSMALLVDEQLYATCTGMQKEVMALTQVLGEDVQLTSEEMELVLSELKKMQTQELPEELQSGIEIGQLQTDALTEQTEEVGMLREPEEGKKPAAVKQENITAVTDDEKDHLKDRSMKDAKAEPKENVTVEKTVESAGENGQETDMAEQNQAGNRNQPEMQQTAEPSVQNAFQAKEAFTSFTSYDGIYESIIRQVGEQIRVQVTADTSFMEMQLNPEHLGKLGLSVELKQGMLTARFVAENEQVKEAIENQAVVLREDLNRQGVKVEAIEVTVETHEFERNLEQGQQQSQTGEQAENAEKQSGRRNLNLDILEDEEELTEAEDLAAKIMKENGNTMDYFA